MTALNPEAQVKNTIQEKTEATIAPEKTEKDLPQKTETAQQNIAENIPQQGNEDLEKDPNWRAFREARKKDREERQAAETKAAEKEREVQALKAAMEAAFSKSAPSPQAYQQYYGMNQGYDQPEETQEQLIEKKLNAILEQREQKYMQEAAERERREYPIRLAREFPDFSHVCSQENLDYLDYHYPELSRPLQRLTEGYDKWHDIYHAVKKFIPNYAIAKKEAARAEANSNKPKSMSTTQLTQSGDNTRESLQDIKQRRAQRYAEMQKTLRSVG